MILMTGGAFQGALDCAAEIYENTFGKITGEEPRVADGREGLPTGPVDIWDHVTDYFRDRLVAGEMPETAEREIRELTETNPRIILITTELGCGLVPVDPRDRLIREAHGRMCCRLAEQASAVYRVCCGIPQCIKGESTCY